VVPRACRPYRAKTKCGFRGKGPPISLRWPTPADGLVTGGERGYSIPSMITSFLMVSA